MLVVAAVAGCVWACASAPWWSLILLAGLSALLADPLWAKVAGGVVFAAALYVGAKMRSQPVPRAVLVGASLVVMATAGDVWKFGISSLIGIGLAVTVAVLGLLRRPGRDRRIAIRVGAVAGGVAVLGVAGLAVAGFTARDDLSAGNTAVREGMRLAKEGEFDAAQASFEVAAIRFRQADDAVRMPWAQVSRVVPIAAQHRTRRRRAGRQCRCRHPHARRGDAPARPRRAPHRRLAASTSMQSRPCASRCCRCRRRSTASTRRWPIRRTAGWSLRWPTG